MFKGSWMHDEKLISVSMMMMMTIRRRMSLFLKLKTSRQCSASVLEIGVKSEIHSQVYALHFIFIFFSALSSG